MLIAKYMFLFRCVQVMGFVGNIVKFSDGQ